MLHNRDPVKHNQDLWEEFCREITVIRHSTEEPERGAFLEALKKSKWEDFGAVYILFWVTVEEMRRWDKELLPLLPKSMEIYASAGAGFD
jgi:hypothetical protein